MRSDAHYPDESTLVNWATSCTYVELAAKCGVSKSSLRDYLRIRPDLKCKIEAIKKPVTVPKEIQAQKRAASTRAWKQTNREKVRAQNRKWAKNQSAEKRKQWNTYNQNRRRAGSTDVTSEDLWWLDVLRNDPCPYGCFETRGSIDHVTPIKSGGTDSLDNLSGICYHHNSSKGSKSLLEFMLWRLANV